MNGPINPLDNLRDIHLPADPGWWPPAIGWWLVAAIIFAILIALFRLAVRWHTKSKQIRFFRKQIGSIAVDSLETAEQKQSAIAEISKQVKQFCMHLVGRQAVAQIHGKTLLSLLDKLTATTEFTSGKGQPLADGGYRLDDNIDVAALKRVVLDTLAQRSVMRVASRIVADER